MQKTETAALSAGAAVGGALRADNPEARREAARQLGGTTSERKTEAARQNAKLGGRPKGMAMSEESKARMRETMARRRAEKEQAAQ